MAAAPLRREFITWSAGGAFLLTLGWGAARSQAAAEAPVLSPWIRIAPDGRVTLATTASDMGQGSGTGQIQVLADELDVAWDMIDVEMAPDREPFRYEGRLYSGAATLCAPASICFARRGRRRGHC